MIYSLSVTHRPVISLAVTIALFLILILFAIFHATDNTRSFTYLHRTSRDSECLFYTPLFADIEHTSRYWSRLGGLQKADLERSRYLCERDGNCAVVKIFNGGVYLRLPLPIPHSFQTRLEATLLMLIRTDFTGLPNVDFVINSNDGVRILEPCFWENAKSTIERDSKSRECINHFLIPDFTTFAWPEAKLPPFSTALHSLWTEFEGKKSKMVWRGSTSLQQATQRVDLVSTLGPQTTIADVSPIYFNQSTKAIEGDFLTMEEFCKYKYIIYTEGITYSGRLKYTALCNSVQMGFPITYHEFWTHLIDDHYVQIDDPNDAISKFEALESQPLLAARKARDTALALRKYVTPKGTSCYLRHLVMSYASSCRWETLEPGLDTRGRVKGEIVALGVAGDHFDLWDEQRGEFRWIELESYLLDRIRAGELKE